jgi:hypothetical protein
VVVHGLMWLITSPLAHAASTIQTPLLQ